jgi:heat shock protein HslJ
MKNINILLIAIFAGLSFTAYGKENYSQNLANTMWILVEVSNSKTSETLTYPTEFHSYIIEFQGIRTINFPNYCNYSHGNYTANENGNIKFTKLGTGTRIDCEGIYELEMQIVLNLPNAEKYHINSDKLTITCGTTTLIFKRFVQQDNPLANSEWRIEPNYLGIDESVNEYSLFVKDDAIHDLRNFVRFFSDGTFCSFDRQPCGNSCFTKVYGKYSFPESNILSLSVDSVNRDCSSAGGTNETEIRNDSEISFKILNFSQYGFKLKKIE